MIGSPKENPGTAHTSNYQIRIGGWLDQHWGDWLDDLVITRQEDGTTLITGLRLDEAALFGLLNKIRDSGMKLISVNQVDTPPKQDSGSETP